MLRPLSRCLGERQERGFRVLSGWPPGPLVLLHLLVIAALSCGNAYLAQHKSIAVLQKRLLTCRVFALLEPQKCKRRLFLLSPISDLSHSTQPASGVVRFLPGLVYHRRVDLDWQQDFLREYSKLPPISQWYLPQTDPRCIPRA